MYTSICHSDILTVRGNWGPVDHFPFCPGHEVIGVITHLGKNCKLRKVGETVGVSPLRGSCGKCEGCHRGFDQHCDKKEFVYHNKLSYFGGYSTHIQC